MDNDNVEEMSGKDRSRLFCRNHWHGMLMVLIPIFFLPLLFFEPHKEFRCLYLVAVMAFYWITEIIPLYVTSLLPIVLLPVMGILDSQQVCMEYFKDTLILFFGGLIIALAIEFCDLHRRIALGAIMMVGCSPRRLNFGLIMVTMFLSMWISNSATTAMMCPIIKAVLSELEAQGMLKLHMDKPPKHEDDPPFPSKSSMCYYLSVAYAATIGGCGTLIGTGTNLTFKGLFDSRFPDSNDTDFMSFMCFSAPPMLVHTILTYIWLQWLYMGLLRPKSTEAAEMRIGRQGAEISRAVIQQRYRELGRLSCHEIQVILLFLTMIVLLFTRKPGVFDGWADYLSARVIKGSLPMMVVTILLFLLPINCLWMKYFVGKRPVVEKTAPSLISWKFVHDNLPWGLLFLLGGGFALAKGVKVSGLAVMVGESLTILSPLPPPAIQMICIVMAVALTAFSSNVAICNIIIPVLTELSVALEINPLYLCLPAGLAVSMAFFLPVSTPPNAIVAGFSHIRVKDMAIAGIGPSVITSVGFWVAAQYWGPYIYPDMTEFPEWAQPENTTDT